MIRLVLLVGGLSILMLVVVMAVARADEASESNMIVFVSHRDPERIGLYIMTAEGSSVRRIFTVDHPLDWLADPAWSPDGEWIAFSMTLSSSRNTHIYRVRLDGSGLQRLTRDVVSNYGAAWSPDGEQIAFYTGNNVFVVRADGGEQVQLTQDGYNLFPAWSPDGEWIAFIRGVLGQDGRPTIYRMRPDGSGLQMLGTGELNEFSPEFSADGESIIFASEPGGNRQAGYYRMRIADRVVTMLDDPFRQHVSITPVDWSASGEWAVYQEGFGFNQEIIRIRIDGSGAEQLTYHEAEDIHPSWSPPMSLAWRGWLNALVGMAMFLGWMIVTARETV